MPASTSSNSLRRSSRKSTSRFATRARSARINNEDIGNAKSAKSKADAKLKPLLPVQREKVKIDKSFIVPVPAITANRRTRSNIRKNPNVATKNSCTSQFDDAEYDESLPEALTVKSSAHTSSIDTHKKINKVAEKQNKSKNSSAGNTNENTHIDTVVKDKITPSRPKRQIKRHDHAKEGESDTETEEEKEVVLHALSHKLPKNVKRNKKTKSQLSSTEIDLPTKKPKLDFKNEIKKTYSSTEKEECPYKTKSHANKNDDRKQRHKGPTVHEVKQKTKAKTVKSDVAIDSVSTAKISPVDGIPSIAKLKNHITNGTKPSADALNNSLVAATAVVAPQSTSSSNFTLSASKKPLSKSSKLSSGNCTSNSTTGRRSLDHCQWENMFQELLKFKKQFGHCRVPRRYADNTRLGRWVAKQRTEYVHFQNKDRHDATRALITPERIKRLNDQSFEWTVRKRHAKRTSIKDSDTREGTAPVACDDKKRKQAQPTNENNKNKKRKMLNNQDKNNNKTANTSLKCSPTAGMSPDTDHETSNSQNNDHETTGKISDEQIVKISPSSINKINPKKILHGGEIAHNLLQTNHASTGLKSNTITGNEPHGKSNNKSNTTNDRLHTLGAASQALSSNVKNAKSKSKRRVKKSKQPVTHQFTSDTGNIRYGSPPTGLQTWEEKLSFSKQQEYDQWEQMLHKLLVFEAVHGHTEVPYPYEKDPALGIWTRQMMVQLQQSKDSSTLSIYQRKQLEVIGLKHCHPTLTPAPSSCSNANNTFII